jgi:hypothetical protein
MPCAECGASVERAEADAHMCDSEPLLDFRLFRLREEILAFDAQLAAWLASARGRFAAWVAERQARVGLARWIDYPSAPPGEDPPRRLFFGEELSFDRGTIGGHADPLRASRESSWRA